MSEYDLIERYIYAVTKKLPKRMREDISKELYSLIMDMLESRCGEIKPTDKDIRVVLTELGTPSDLANNYLPEKVNYLIGPEYYQAYKTILLIVIAATSFGMVLSGCILLIIGSDEFNSILNFMKWIGNTFFSIIMVFAFITFFFAFFERRGIKIDINENSLDELPPVPSKEELIPRSGTIFSISFSIIFCILFLLIPQIFSFTDGKIWIPIFNVSSIQHMWYLFIIYMLCSLLRDFYKFHIGRYTKKLAIISIISNFLSIIPAYFFTHTYSLMNHDFIIKISSYLNTEKDTVFILFIMNNIPSIFFAVIVFALILDSVTTAIKAYQYDKS